MRAFSQTVEVKPGPCWRSQDVGDTVSIGYMPKRATDKKIEPAQEREMCVAKPIWKGRHILAVSVTLPFL